MEHAGPVATLTLCRPDKKNALSIALRDEVSDALDEIAVRLVHRDEPLRRRTKDHRVLAAPAMRVAVVILLTEKQHAFLTHELDNRIVRIKHALAREVFNFGRETSRVIDRAINIEPVTLANHEVVMTMARRGVYGAGTGLVV